MMLSYFCDQIRKAGADQGGQTLIFVALVCLILVAFAATVINVGDLTVKRIQMQNAADAVSLSGAAWVARGLNLISLLNVTITQVIALTVLLDSVDETNQRSIKAAQIQMKIAQAMMSNPLTQPAGIALMASAKAALLYLNSAGKGLAEAIRISGAVDHLWRIAGSLATMEEAIVTGFPLVAQGEAIRIGRKNGADGAILSPVLPRLPVEKGKFPDLCGPARGGGPGYALPPPATNKKGEGPFPHLRRRAIPFWVPPAPGTLPFGTSPKIYRGVTERKLRDLCRTSDRPVPYLLKERPHEKEPGGISYVAYWRNHLDIVGVAYLKKEHIRPILLEGFFPLPFDHGILTVGQARVYNPTSEDLFTQDWQVTLVPVDLRRTHQALEKALPSLGVPARLIRAIAGRMLLH